MFAFKQMVLSLGINDNPSDAFSTVWEERAWEIESVLLDLFNKPG